MNTCRRQRIDWSTHAPLGLAIAGGALATVIVPLPVVAGVGVAVTVAAQLAARAARSLPRRRWDGGWGGELGGVREPRRPRTPRGSASMAAEPPGRG